MSADTSLKNRLAKRLLTTSFQAMNSCVQAKLRYLRQSLYVGHGLGRADRISAQRHRLAEELGVSPTVIGVLEATDYLIPAAVTLILSKRFDLDLTYFTSPESPLSANFIAEQQTLELADIIKTAKMAVHDYAKPTRFNAKSTNTRKKGGWLKGLPRNPKSREQIALLELWNQAKKTGFLPKTLTDLVKWGIEHKIEGAEKLLAIAVSAEQEAKARMLAKRMGSSSLASPIKKGGWLKGIPRHPKNEAEQFLYDVWKKSRAANVHLNEIEELFTWWQSHTDHPESLGEELKILRGAIDAKDNHVLPATDSLALATTPRVGSSDPEEEAEALSPLAVRMPGTFSDYSQAHIAFRADGETLTQTFPAIQKLKSLSDIDYSSAEEEIALEAEPTENSAASSQSRYHVSIKSKLPTTSSTRFELLDDLEPNLEERMIDLKQARQKEEEQLADLRTQHQQFFPQAPSNDHSDITIVDRLDETIAPDSEESTADDDISPQAFLQEFIKKQGLD